MPMYDNVDNVLVNILESVRALVAAFYNSRNIEHLMTKLKNSTCIKYLLFLPRNRGYDVMR